MHIVFRDSNTREDDNYKQYRVEITEHIRQTEAGGNTKQNIWQYETDYTV